MKTKKLISIVIAATMFSSIIEPSIFSNKTFAVTLDHKIITNVDKTKNIKKIGVQRKTLKNIAKNENLFSKETVYTDELNYSGIIPRTNIDWSTNVHTETEHKHLTKKYTVTSKNTNDTFDMKETISGHLYKGKLDKTNIEYKPTKYGKRPIYKTYTKNFSKELIKEHLDTNDDNEFNNTYRINEDGYRGNISRADLKWEGSGRIEEKSARYTMEKSHDDFEDKYYYSDEDGYSGYIDKYGSVDFSGKEGDVREYTRHKPFNSPSMLGEPPDPYIPTWAKKKGYIGKLWLRNSRPYKQVLVLGESKSKTVRKTEYSDRDNLRSSIRYNENGYEGTLHATGSTEKVKIGGGFESGGTKEIRTMEDAEKVGAVKEFDAGHNSYWRYYGLQATNKHGYYKYSSGSEKHTKRGMVYQGHFDGHGLEGPYLIPKGWDSYGGESFGRYDKSMVVNEDGYRGTLHYNGKFWQRLELSPYRNITDHLRPPARTTVPAIGTQKMKIYYTGTLKKEGHDSREYWYARDYEGEVETPSDDHLEYRYKYTGTLSKPDTRRYEQRYRGHVEKLVGDYKGIANYKGQLTKTIIDHYETIPVEWEATVTYDGDINYVWYDYNGIATYRGEVTKLEPIIDIGKNEKSTWKQNRKVIISLKNSISEIPVDNSKTKFEITPITNGLTDEDIKTKIHDNVCEAVFKKAGDYNCKLTITNGELTTTKETKITIKPDEKPIVDFAMNDIEYRDIKDGDKATINIQDATYSKDNDIIKQRKWRYKYDSNNDGSFSDEQWRNLDTGNNTNPKLRTNKVGKYLVELDATEEFGQPTIPEFVTEADKQHDDTDKKPIQQKIVEVDNLPPFASFTLNQKPKTDVVLAVGKCNNGQTKNLNDKLQAYVKSKLSANGIDANIQAIEAFEQTILSGKFSVNVYWDHGGDMDSFMSFYSKGSKDSIVYYGNKSQYGCSLDRDDTNGGSGEWFTLNFNTIPDKIDEIRFAVNSYRGKGSADVDVRLYKESNGVKTCPVRKSSHVSSEDKVYFGKLVRNENVWDFHGADGEFVPGKIVKENVKPFDEVLKEPKWNQNSHHFIIDLTDDKFLKNVDANKETSILSNLLTNNTSLIGLGNGYNKTEFQNFIQRNSGKGIFLDNSNMDSALSKLGDYIVQQVLQNANNSEYVVVGEKVDYTTNYQDSEKDPEMDRKWKYVHDPNYFENSQGQASFSGKWIDSAINRFDKVGKYTVSLKAKDNPVGNDERFAKYRKWSDESASEYIFYVHRRPIVQFTAIAKRNLSHNNFDTIVNESSYDLDHMSHSNKGIVEKKWCWKNAKESNWHESMIPSSLPKDENYLIQLKVKDEDGAWSEPVTQYVTTKNINISPIAQFEINPMITTISNNYTIKDLSYDPNGDAITQKHWTIFDKNNRKIYDGYSKPSMSNIRPYGVGTYKITLRVKDNPQSGLPLESEPYSQFLTVIPDNQAPIASFEVTPNPIPTDVNVNIKDKSYDPDNDKIIEKQWRIKNYTSGTWIYLNEPPTRFDKYGIGKIQIQLRVKDQAKHSQQTSKWSNWTEKIVTVLKGNEKPIAAFNPSPNPVPADEPVSYNDTSYDTEGKRIIDKIWTVTCKETGEVHEFRNEEPPKVFELTGWGKNLDGVGTYDITLKVKDSSPNGMSPSLWSNPVTKTLVVEDPLRINALTMVKLVNAPKTTKLPVYYPTLHPTDVKVGYKMKFNVNTNGGDKLDIKFYANGKPLVVHAANENDSNTMTIHTKRKDSNEEFEFWLDKKLPKGTIIDMKLVLTKTKLDGTTKSLVNTELGYNAIKVTGSSLLDYMINLTN